MGNLFKKAKSAASNYVGSVSGDANQIKDTLSKFGSAESISNMFDHRIAMSAFCIGQIFGGKITISDCHSISTSFPNFLKIMKKIKSIYFLL